MKRGTISVHQVFDENKLSFSPFEYSLFKHGSIKLAKKFGIELAEMVLSSGLLDEIGTKQIVVLCSAYHHVPTASANMTKFFIDKLNDFLVQSNYPVIQQVKIQRQSVYKEDYGKMSLEVRKKMLSKDSFYTDFTFLKDKFCFFIDDLKMTGTHEDKNEEMIKNSILSKEELLHFDYCYLYYSEIKKKELPANYESFLNNYAIKTSNDLIKYVNLYNDFSMLVRPIKLLLGTPTSEFRKLTSKMNIEFIYELYHSAIGNDYNKVDKFKSNLISLKEKLNS